MYKTILQVPMDKRLKNNAEKVASEQGFSSLQEVVRVFLAQLASNKVSITLQETISLSTTNEDLYSTMTEDFEIGNDVYQADNVKMLISKLNADKIS